MANSAHTGGMSEPVPSPYPPGTTEEVIWVDARGRVLPDQQGAVRGETIVTFPDGRTEYTLFTLQPVN
jgi:hypothetical protein